MNRELEELAAILKTPAESQGEEQVEDLELLRERYDLPIMPATKFHRELDLSF